MRNNKLLVYGSSYDRGLEHLLKMWPEVKKEVSEAELHIFYGWDLFLVGYKDNPERMAWMEKINKLMEQEGITHLGRIGHEAVQREFEKAGVWAYPTHFGEISCITAMKAQAFGAVPCVINYAALKETVRFGVKVEGDIYEPEVRELYKNSLIALLKDEKYQQEVRKEMIPWAKENFIWSNIARQWDEEFKRPKTIEEQVDDLMENNESLKAWELVKDTDLTIKNKVYSRVKHAFEPEAYKKFYAEDLNEKPIPEELAVDCMPYAPRFSWVVGKLESQRPKSILDLGCADGYLTLTVANKGIKAKGINLYEPSIKVAKERAARRKLPAEFECKDLFEVKEKHDAVILMEVLEHLPDDQKAVDHCMSLVNDGGSFYLSVPSTQHLGIKKHKEEPNHKKWFEEDGPAGHLRMYTQQDLEKLFSKYKIVDIMTDPEGCILLEAKNV